MSGTQCAIFDRYLAHCEREEIELAAFMLSPETFDVLKGEIPRKQYRKRVGTKFINAYSGVPIQIHDEWSWGWMLRATDGSFVSLPREAA